MSELKAQKKIIKSDLNERWKKTGKFPNRNLNDDFDTFLKKLNLNLNQYIMILRANIKAPTVFLKRKLKDIRTNAYNVFILMLHQANMDIQFILDIFACIAYILKYIVVKSSSVQIYSIYCLKNLAEIIYPIKKPSVKV